MVAAATIGLFAVAADAAPGRGPPSATPADRPARGCPLAEAREAAEISVENTATGAVVRFQAKGGAPADVEKAQQLAQHVGTMLKEGPQGCPMKGKGPQDCPMKGQGPSPTPPPQ
jgi:hypothetical protein